MAHNGPAVGLSKRYPTQHPDWILVPRLGGADILSRCKEGMARVFAIQVQMFDRKLARSRYKLDRNRYTITRYKTHSGYWCSVAVGS